MNIAFKRFLRTMTVCMALVCLLGVHASAEGYIIPAEQTPQAAYRYFPNGITSDLVFYFPNALNASFWENLPASIYYDYPDGNLPPDVQEYYRQNIEPVLSGGGRIPGLPPKAYDFYPNGLPDDFLAYFPSAMREDFWTYFPNSIVMDYGDELPPNAWNYFLSVSPDSLNLGLTSLDLLPDDPEGLSEVLTHLRDGFWDSYADIQEGEYADWFESGYYSALADGKKTEFAAFHEKIRSLPSREYFVKTGGTVYFAGQADRTVENACIITAQDVVTNDHLARGGRDRNYNGEFIALDDCTYTFEPVPDSMQTHEAENHTEAQYYIKSTKGDVYLTPPEAGVNYKFNTGARTATRVERILSANGSYRFAFSRATPGQSWSYRYIFFEKVNSAGHAYKFDVWPRTPRVTAREVSLLFDLYEQITGTDESKSYVRATEILPTTAEETHKYVIAATIREADAPDTEENFTYRFLLRPSLDFSNSNVYTQSVKWTDGVVSNTVDGYRLDVDSNITFGAGETLHKDAGILVFEDVIHRVHAVRRPTAEELADSTVLSVTGSASGNDISKISMSLGSVYRVAAPAGVSAKYWISENENVATVDENGLISAVGVTSGNYGKTWVAYMDTANRLHAIEVVVINQKLSANKKLMDILLTRDDDHSDIRAASVSNVYRDTDYPLKKTYPKEVYYYEFDVDEEAALAFFVKPFFGDLNSDKNSAEAPAWDEDGGEEKTSWFTVAEDDIRINGASATELQRNNPDSLDVFRPKNDGDKDNVQFLLNSAAAESFHDYVTFVSPSYSNLKARAAENGENTVTVPDIVAKLSMGSSPRIRVTQADDHAYDKNSVYRLVIDESADDAIWTAGDLPAHCKLAEAYITKDGVKLHNVTVQNAETVAFTIPTELLSVEGLDGNHLRYQVQTIHGEQVQDLGIFSKDSSNRISLSVSQFSPFLITPTDEYYKLTIEWQTADAQVNYQDTYQWNPRELCYERISTQLFTTTPGTADITVTSESTRDVDYAISYASRPGYCTKSTPTADSAKAADTLLPGNVTPQSIIYKTKFSVDDGSGLPDADYGKSQVSIGTYTVTVSKSHGE